MSSSCAEKREVDRREPGLGTVSKLDDEIMGITSKHFYDYQMPAPPEVNQALQEFFG